MVDESGKKRWVRFDFPRGADAATIAEGINELRCRILDEAAAEQKQATELNAREAEPEPPERQ